MATTSTNNEVIDVAVVDENEEPSVLDALVDDAAAPTDYPEGAPLLQPYLQIRPRSKRAEFKRKFADLGKIQDKVKEVRKSGLLTSEDPSDQLRLSAELDDMYEQMLELLEMAAVSPAAFREWAEAVDDGDLIAVFNVYMRRTQPGEASSSAS